MEILKDAPALLVERIWNLPGQGKVPTIETISKTGSQKEIMVTEGGSGKASREMATASLMANVLGMFPNSGMFLGREMPAPGWVMLNHSVIRPETRQRKTPSRFSAAIVLVMWPWSRT